MLRSSRVVVTFDHAPLGFMATAAHGHADALSVWASLDDSPLLVDTGTLGYNGVPTWRSWARSTAAHNTLAVDGTDQSAITGRFTWGRRARAELVELDLDGGRVSALHDGYASLGVTHRRSVHLAEATLTVIDLLEGEGERDVLVCWHLAPGLEVEDRGDVVAIIRDHVLVAVLRLQGEGLDLSIHEQVEEPGPGWISPRWSVRLPAPCLVYAGRVRMPARWIWSFDGA